MFWVLRVGFWQKRRAVFKCCGSARRPCSSKHAHKRGQAAHIREGTSQTPSFRCSDASERNPVCDAYLRESTFRQVRIDHVCFKRRLILTIRALIGLSWSLVGPVIAWRGWALVPRPQRTPGSMLVEARAYSDSTRFVDSSVKSLIRKPLRLSQCRGAAYSLLGPVGACVKGTQQSLVREPPSAMSTSLAHTNVSIVIRSG
jgi:hypothetical protein